LAGERAEIEAVTASGVEYDVAWRCIQDLADRAQQRPGHAPIVQATAGRDGGRGIARLLRSPLLRLQQIDVSAARYVERMPARAEQPPLLARQRQVALAHRAEEHGSSVAHPERTRTRGSPDFGNRSNVLLEVNE